MAQTQVILLRSCSEELAQQIDASGPIVFPGIPNAPVNLSRAPNTAPETGRVLLSRFTVDVVTRLLALSCTYEDNKERNAVHHQLNLVAIALQLVKPTSPFLRLWMQLDGGNMVVMAERGISDLGVDLGPEPYLQYQQHNSLTQPDVKRALALLPRITQALEKQHDSWNHPLLPIHRALILFCQGYSAVPPDSRQFFWSAGLDCLYASKIERKKQGSPEICRRMQQFLGAKMKLYEANNVTIPCHQKTRTHKELDSVSADIFKLRNAFAHGLTIPDSWLYADGQPPESGYAYQLLEQTEIALRLSLIKILEDQVLFETFSNATRLDAFFS
jgi:hypothetical protein